MSPSKTNWVALVGRRDSPTDAVDDYCACLAAAIGQHGVMLESVRVDWAGHGWLAALRRLRREGWAWRGRWVLVQYTALAWSRRGLTLGFLLTIRRLRRSGARIAIVYHDPLAFPGESLRDRARRRLQEFVMRRAALHAQRSITAIPPERVSWMRELRVRGKLVVVPIGSNVPECWQDALRHDSPVSTLAVFGITERNESEAKQLARVVKTASETLGAIRLIVLGRGASEAEPILSRLLAASAVHLEVHGIVSGEEVRTLLCSAHAQLFMRAGIAARRGTVVAGICCGLPIVGWADEETAFPVTEAGLRTVPIGDEAALVREIFAVLTDSALRAELRERSRRAAEHHFSWDSIARQMLAALGADTNARGSERTAT